MSKLEPNTVREDAIQAIAAALALKDQHEAVPFTLRGQGRYAVHVEFQPEAAYLMDAERLLDAEIVQMARERVMASLGR